MVKINNWKIVHCNFDPYLAPELITVHLGGNVVDHPKLGNTHIRTSPIVKIKGRIVTTKSGSVYKLGKIDPEYRKWIRKNYGNWDWKNPIKVKEA